MKKGAMELSISTIVIIVLAMSMLILGLVLVKNIFTGSTQSINILNEKTQAEIIGMLGNENADVGVKLGPDKLAKISPGTDDFGVAIGAKTLDGSATDESRLQYKLKLSDTDRESCLTILGKTKTEDLLNSKLDTYMNFDEFSGSNSLAIIYFSIPKGTATCTQKILIAVQDTKTSQPVGGASFAISVKKTGLGIF